LVLPAAKRQAIVAVWDFCRAVDDAVDEAPVGTSAAQVARWREELARCVDGRPPETPQGRALQPLVPAFNLPRRAFDMLIEGVEMDLHTTRYATFADLYEYCIRVASAVGLMCVEIFGCKDPASRQYAIDLGVALQLTNILRDVPKDLERGRLYIPMEDMERFHCTERMLQDQWRTPPVISLLRYQAERARHYYFRAARLLPRRERRRLAAAEIMGATYYALLNEIERRNYDVFTETVKLPASDKASLAFRTWLRALTGGRSYIQLLEGPVPGLELLQSRTHLSER